MPKNNENDIEELMTTELGWTKASERSYLKRREMGLDLERLTDFIKLIVPLMGAFASGLFPGLVAASLVYYAALPGIGAFEASAFASAAFFGKIAASAVGGSLADWLGRTTAIRLAAGLSLLGVVVALMVPGLSRKYLIGANADEIGKKLHEVIRVLQGLMAALERRTER